MRVVEHELFTQNYTQVLTADEKEFNAHHHYLVKSVETGKELAEVKFQKGPIKENGVNGIHNEDLILMVIDRLESFQESEYKCEENAEAIEHLNVAVGALRSRTNKRIERGVEGTSTV